MNSEDPIAETHHRLVERLLAERTGDGVWVGALSSSAVSTATATVALAAAAHSQSDLGLAGRGRQWLVEHQNDDGGWGDTTLSASNISTTALCWAALAFAPPQNDAVCAADARAAAWLDRAAGGLHPEQLRSAIAKRYGKDRTFSAPILTALAIAGRLGTDGWRFVPQLPFELAALPQRWFQFLQLPVVSYALPALIAIGQARHHHRPSANAVVRLVRRRCAEPTRRVLRAIQPATGGYLEATPLTSFVVMSLAATQQGHGDVAREGLRFLRASMRDDGSWPIDTNLSTWVTTLAITALAPAGHADTWLGRHDREQLAAWLLRQQHCDLHPYTGTPPGGWAWTPLAGGVPDADDTAGALLALRCLGVDAAEVSAAAVRGVTWLMGLQNRDGGVPTFCRGWGTLPFDRSAPDLTAHALLAWHAWLEAMPPEVAARTRAASRRAMAYLRSSQRQDGAWIPLWFGNQRAADDVNATYGTAKVVAALAQVACREAMLGAGQRWLLAAQNRDGGWGGDCGVASSIEETSFAVDALAASEGDASVDAALDRGVQWLTAQTEQGRDTPPAPIGLYFAKLWYFDALYPLIFAAAALGRVAGSHARGEIQRPAIELMRDEL